MAARPRPPRGIWKDVGVTVRRRFSSGIDLTHVDSDARPQDDLFVHVNGRWLAEYDDPGRPRHRRSVPDAVRPRRGAGPRPDHRRPPRRAPAQDTDEQRIGDLYASFMDEPTVAARGVQPLLDELAAIDAAPTPPTPSPACSAQLQRTGVGGGTGVYVDTDSKDSTRYLLHLSQSGLGLPDESYYRDEQHAEILAAYPQAHRARCSRSCTARRRTRRDRRADRRLETKLAAAHWDVVKRRDADLTYNLRTFADLPAEAPGFDWAGWVTALGTSPETVAEIVVRQPDYLTAFAALWAGGRPSRTGRLWLRWRLIHARASLLDRRPGRRELRVLRPHAVAAPRRSATAGSAASSLVEDLMGDAVGKLYVERHFPPDAKARMDESGRQPARGLPRQHQRPGVDDAGRRASGRWPSSTSSPRRSAIRPSGATIRRWSSTATTCTATTAAATPSDYDRELDKLGGPVDRDEWFMTPQTVNAYYNPGMNEIVFPAAILQPPFFDAEADDAANYGGIGAVIGHEIGHGFDDQGAKYDGDGNLVDWWTDERPRRIRHAHKGFDRAVRRVRAPRARATATTSTARSPSVRTSATSAGCRSRCWPTRCRSAASDGPGDRRTDRRAAGVLRLGAGVAHQVPRRRGDPAAGHRPALTAGVPLQRRHPQHRRVLRRVRRQRVRRAVPGSGTAGADLELSRQAQNPRRVSGAFVSVGPVRTSASRTHRRAGCRCPPSS